MITAARRRLLRDRDCRLTSRILIPIITTIQGAEMTVGAIKVARNGDTGVRSITEYHRLVN